MIPKRVGQRRVSETGDSLTISATTSMPVNVLLELKPRLFGFRTSFLDNESQGFKLPAIGYGFPRKHDDGFRVEARCSGEICGQRASDLADIPEHRGTGCSHLVDVGV